MLVNAADGSPPAGERLSNDATYKTMSRVHSVPHPTARINVPAFPC